MLPPGAGVGWRHKQVALQAHFRHLEVAEILNSVTAACNICFMLDYDGTLTAERGCSLAIPPTVEVR